MKMGNRIGKIALTVLVFLTAGSILVMLLWNVLMPGLFNLHAISFWQAAGLLVLSKILFGGRGYSGMFFRREKNYFQEKWKNMTPDQRKEFIANRRKHGFSYSRNSGAEEATADSQASDVEK